MITAEYLGRGVCGRFSEKDDADRISNASLLAFWHSDSDQSPYQLKLSFELEWNGEPWKVVDVLLAHRGGDDDPIYESAEFLSRTGMSGEEPGSMTIQVEADDDFIDLSGTYRQHLPGHTLPYKLQLSLELHKVKGQIVSTGPY